MFTGRKQKVAKTTRLDGSHSSRLSHTQKKENADIDHDVKVTVVKPESGIKSNVSSTKQSKEAQEVPISLAALSRSYLGDASVARKHPIWSNKYDNDSDEDSSCDGSTSGVNSHKSITGPLVTLAWSPVAPSDAALAVTQYDAASKAATSNALSEFSPDSTSPPAADVASKAESKVTKATPVSVALTIDPILAMIPGSRPVVAKTDPTTPVAKITTSDVVSWDKTFMTVTKDARNVTVTQPAPSVPLSKPVPNSTIIKTKPKITFPILTRRFAGKKATCQSTKAKEACNAIVTKSSPEPIGEAASNINVTKPSPIRKAASNTIITEAAPEPTLTTAVPFETIVSHDTFSNVIPTVDVSTSDSESVELCDDEGSDESEKELNDDDILDSDEEEDLLNTYLLTKKRSWDEHLFSNMKYKFCGMCF